MERKAKLTLDELHARAAKRTPEEIAEFQRRADSLTEEQLHRHATEEGNDPDEEIRDEQIISPWYIRRRLKLTQEQFARVLRIPVATLRNWEQNRVAMDPSTIALMTILAREPEAALRALGYKNVA